MTSLSYYWTQNVDCEEKVMPDFQRVASAGDIPPGEMTIVEVNGEEVVIANVNGEFYCFNNSCSHRGGPLGEGLLLEGGIVECPFHAGQFNVRTGELVAAPPTEPIATYPVELNGDDVSVAVT
jgi:nitrite reductase/ring-hydroxylating ferredoxin subunit